MSSFSVPFKSLQMAPSKTCLALVGTMKHGKTTCALSVSEKFDPSFSKPQVLDDIGVITTEADAMQGAKLMGVEVAYWQDLTDYTNKGQKVFDSALDSAMATQFELAAQGKIKALIVDTVSTLDKTWKSYLTKQYEKWGLIDALLVKHREFLVTKLLSFPVPTIILMHTRKVSTEMDPIKREAQGLDTEDRLVMDISGWDAPSLYRAQCSYIVPIKKTEQKGKPDEFFLYPRGVSGIEAGGRYGLDGAPDKLPANLRLFFEVVKAGGKTA